MISGRMVSLLGIRLNILSMEKGNARRIPASPHSATFTHLGAFFRSRRSRITASISQPAEILMFTIFEIFLSLRPSPPEFVDHPLHFIDLLPGNLSVPGKCRYKGRERAFELLLHQFIDL